MSSIAFDLDLTDTEREIQRTIHRFAEEVIRPAGQELDRMPDPDDTIAPGSIMWRVLEQYAALGIDEFVAGDSDLTPMQHARIRAIINEELGWGEAGLALVVSSCGGGMAGWLAQATGNVELMERYAPGNTEIGCWAITEPDHGSDVLALTESHFSDPDVKANCIARRDGDDYVIRGQKSSWVSAAPIATVMGLYCTIEGDRGFEGGGIALIPMDTPGVARGRLLDKVGQRSMPQGEVFFDDVRIPKNQMVYGQDEYAAVLRATLTMANSWMGVTFAGVARSAFDLANQYAKDRVQGGRPINQHQSVKLRLFDMFRKVETASTLARKAFVFNTASEGELHFAIASKTYATRVAFDVASEALQIFGGNGLSREYPIEKIMRDARASMIEDGCNEVLSIVGASQL